MRQSEQVDPVETEAKQIRAALKCDKLRRGLLTSTNMKTLLFHIITLSRVQQASSNGEKSARECPCERYTEIFDFDTTVSHAKYLAEIYKEMQHKSKFLQKGV